MLEWTLTVFQTHPRLQHIVLVGASDELDRLRAAAAPFDKVTAVVAGGASRQESVGNGLSALPAACDYVLVHDAARPAVSPALIDRVLNATRHYGAAVPGVPVTDTIQRVREETVVESVVRDDLRAVQTPQGARLDRLRRAYEYLGARIHTMTDESSILTAAGDAVRIVEGDPANIKVTRPEDVERVAAALPRAADTPVPPAIRTGFGYDVHAFAGGRPLWLGGIEIPHTRGLLGHSDADVLLHALCDALLGAAALGDIGILFPDTDAAHKDRASIEFVREVRRRLDAEGWSIVNVDIALLAEEPKVMPYRAQMIAVIADGLKIAPSCINIKATTSEKMGFVGRREGIACWAVATLAGRGTFYSGG